MPLPKFVEIEGNPVGRLPYVADQALLHCFVLDGQYSLLQQLCQRLLTVPSQGVLSFHAASSTVLLTALYVPRMRSGDPVDGTKGYVPEGDVGFWILTVGGDALAPWTWKLRWLPIYMFVDCGPAMTGGREVFGFPKMLGQIERVGTDDDEPRVAVKTLRVATFGPTVGAANGELFRIEAAPAPVQAKVALPQALLGALSAFRTAVTLGAGSVVPTAFLSQLMPPLALGMPMIFLKQFRDVAMPGFACHQAIVEAKAHTNTLHDGGPFDTPLQFRLVASDSHPIAALLGVSDGQAVASAFWLTQDFKQDFGNVLWQAP